MSPLPAQPNRSVMEGLEVLFAVVQERGAVRVRALARELGMTPTRVQRYLGTLAHLGLAHQLPDRSYRVGPGIHALSALSLSASGLTAGAMQVLPRLADLDVIVAMGVLWRNTVSYLYFSVPGMPMAEAIGRSAGYPAEDSSIGLLMLAHADIATVRRYFPEDLARLKPLFDEVRRQGYAVIDRANGERSLAVPVGSPVVAGIAVSGKPAKPWPDVLERLREAAACIEEAMTQAVV